MRALYLMTAPPPAIEGTDAVVQEAEMLRSRLGGERVHLALSSRPWSRYPRPLYGLQKLLTVKRLERQVDLHHIYHAELFPFPVLRLLAKPVVYTVVSGLNDSRDVPHWLLDRLGAIVVPSHRDLERLQRQGSDRGHVLPAGIDLSRYEEKPTPADDPFVLLAGSAPWTEAQFETKGTNALLDVAQQIPSLRLVFLWRGWLLEGLRQRLALRGLSDRVEILTERADVNEVLGGVHAAVVLAAERKLVKAYPHSLLEALACGRPVLVSDCIALADSVRENRCGRVVKGVSRSDLLRGIQAVREDYGRLQENTRRVAERDFSQERLVDAYRQLYESVLGPRSSGE